MLSLYSLRREEVDSYRLGVATTREDEADEDEDENVWVLVLGLVERGGPPKDQSESTGGAT